MDEDTLGFLDGTKPAADPVVVQDPAAKTDVVVEPVVEATPPQPVATAVPNKPEDKSVPLATFLDMRDTFISTRDKLKAAEAQLKAKEPQPEFTPPDPKTDPDGYIQYRENLMDLNLMNDRLHTSERFAVKEHGKDIVEKARTWALERFAADPAYENRVLRLPDPYETVVGDYKNHLLLEEMNPEEVKKYREWKAAQTQGKEPSAPLAEGTPAQPAAPAAPKQPAAKPAVPKSIAGTPASGGGAHAIPQGPGQAFDSLFQGR